MICGKSDRVNGVRDESTACETNRLRAGLPSGKKGRRAQDLVVSMLDGVVGRKLLRIQRLADGAAPRHDRSRIVSGRGRFAIPRLDPGVAGRGTCAEIRL